MSDKNSPRSNGVDEIMSRCVDDLLIAKRINVMSVDSYRSDLCGSEYPLQVSARLLKAGTEVLPHFHNKFKRVTKSTVECWVVFSGSIESEIYDVDQNYLSTIQVGSGDCLILFAGGHSLRTTDTDTVFFEFKNGPYLGSDRDKTIIDRDECIKNQ